MTLRQTKEPYSPDDAETAAADTSITTPNADPTWIPSQTRLGSKP